MSEIKRINTRAELEQKREHFIQCLATQDKQILICGGTGCVAGGSLKIYDRLKELMEERDIACTVQLEEEPHDHSIGLKKSGCHGFCEMGPLLRIEPMGWLYIKVKVEDCEDIIEQSILGDQVVDRLVYRDKDGTPYQRQDDIPFYKQQTRVALEHCGHINAESIREYIAMGGYSAVAKALFDMTPEGIVKEISEAGLRGRGGGVERLSMAIDQARQRGLLGKNILDSGFDFDIHISQGAGAFVCGEGSALTASIEGNRGMPRVKPPRTVEHGLFDSPTVLNNVETYCNVAPIIQKGAAWYKTIGPENNHGTKAFALTGNVNNTGLIEVPMGTPLRKVIFDIGGGVKDGEFKAVQIGGPSGGCLCLSATEDHLDMHLDFDSLKKVGAMIGSGGLVVMNDKSCMVEVARFFMNFTQNESCGKCVPCREGTKRMLEILTDITEGRGTLEHIHLLEELSSTISETALCGLGKSAPSPVSSTLKYFRDEYLAHVVDKKCPAGQCKALVTLQIDPELCRGCTKCARLCPVGAISGSVKQPHVIDTDKCIKCRACLDGCSFSAVKEV